MKKKRSKLNKVQTVNSIKQLLSQAVEAVGDQDAYRYRHKGKDCSVTFREFEQQTNFLGTGLANLGVSKNHVAILCENRYEWICTYLTVLKSDSVYVPIDKELPIQDVLNILEDSESTILFYSEKQEARLQEQLESLSQIRYFIGIDREEDSEDGRFLSYAKLMEQGKEKYEQGDESYTSQTFDHNALKLLVYTSGTTGIAKGVMLSEHNLVSGVYYGLQVSTIYTRGLSVLPYHHTYEAIPGILVAIHHHVTLCINDNLKNVLKNLELYKPEHIYLVPAFVEVFYKRIWATAKKSGNDGKLKVLIKVSNGLRKVGIDLRRTLFASVHKAFGGDLKKIVCGGAPLRPELGYFFESIGVTLLNGYGITECSPLVSVNCDDSTNDSRTVGYPLPCCEIKIAEPDEEGIGEICVKGDVVMLGYYKQPEKTAEVLSEDGWFRTGDYGKLNEIGQLMITGRKKNLIVLDNGKNIFPEEIENLIGAIDYVTEVIVYGHENESGQEESLYAEIYCAPEGIGEISNLEEQLKQDISLVCSELPSYKHIAKIIIRDTEFEKTTSNKIRRNKVVKQ